MPINIRFERKDEHGNIYYEDRYGNRIPDATAEEIAEKEAERERLIAESNRIFFENQRKQQPFWLRPLGNLQKPKEGKPLWSPHPNPLPGGEGVIYWAERELCILAGDNGVGKSLMALQVARQLSEPMKNEKRTMKNGDFDPEENITGSPLKEGNSLPLPVGGDVERSKTEGVQKGESRLDIAYPNPAAQEIPHQVRDDNRVLYVDWELTEEDFVRRWGGEDVPENFFWAGFNTDSEMPQHVPDKIDWLLQNFTTTVKETEANILIIDQPDRLHLSPQKWNEFLTKLKALMRTHKLSVMLVVSNKARHLGRPCGLNNIPKGNLLIPVADSVIMMCQNQRRTCERYFKVLKNRNRVSAENLEFVDIIELENLDGYLNIHPWGYQRERDMLPPNASERKNQQIMQAEKLWNSGLSCLEVGEQIMVAEATVKSWLRPLWSEKLETKSEKSSPVWRPGAIHPLQERDIPRAISPFGGSTADVVGGEGGPQGESRLLHPVIN